MPLRKLLYIHIGLLLFILLDLCFGWAIGYTVAPNVMIIAVFGFLASVLACMFRVGAIYNALKARIGYNAKLVLAMVGIFIIEAATTLCMAAMGFVLLWQSGSKTIAKGSGYEVRLVPAISWPPMYVLYKTPFMLERRVGDGMLMKMILICWVR